MVCTFYAKYFENKTRESILLKSEIEEKRVI